MKFGNIDNHSLVDKVETRLMEYISSDDVNPGDTIPKELELAKSFGVSRTVIREALSRLRMLGLIDSRKHKGMIVSKPDVMSNLERVLHPKIVDEQTLIDAFELRIVLEIGIADLLFARRTEEDIIELNNIVEQESGKANKGIFEIKEELRFHGKLYNICGNNTLKRFQEILLPVFTFVNESEIFHPIIIEKDYVTHKDLVGILQSGTPEEFQISMKKHLEPHMVRLHNRRPE